MRGRAFEQVYEEQFERQYGFFRQYAKQVIYRYLDCGVLNYLIKVIDTLNDRSGLIFVSYWGYGKVYCQAIGSISPEDGTLIFIQNLLITLFFSIPLLKIRENCK